MNPPLRDLASITRQNMFIPNSEIYIESLKGGLIDVAYVDKGEQEAFAYPITDIITKTFEPEDKLYELHRNLLKDARVIAACPRRQSFQTNEPQWKVKTEGKFRKTLFIIYWGRAGSSPKKRRQAGRALAHVSPNASHPASHLLFT